MTARGRPGACVSDAQEQGAEHADHRGARTPDRMAERKVDFRQVEKMGSMRKSKKNTLSLQLEMSNWRSFWNFQKAMDAGPWAAGRPENSTAAVSHVQTQMPHTHGLGGEAFGSPPYLPCSLLTPSLLPAPAGPPSP